MTSLVVLSSRPSLLRRGVLADDHLAEEVAPGRPAERAAGRRRQRRGQLRRRPGAGRGADDDARGGYAVQAADGSTTPGRGAGRRHRAGCSASPRSAPSRDGFRLLYGSPDVAALVHDGQTAVLDAARRGRPPGGGRPRPCRCWCCPAAAGPTRRPLRAAERSSPAAVVLSDASVTDGDGPAAGRRRTAPRSSASAAPRLAAAVPARTRGTPPSRSGSASLADTWVQATEAADGVTRGRVRLVSRRQPGARRRPRRRRPLDPPDHPQRPARRAPRPPGTAGVTYPDEAREAELTGGQLATPAALHRQLVDLPELLADGDARRGAPARPPSPGPPAPPGATRSGSAAPSWRPSRTRSTPRWTTSSEISTNPRVSTVAREGVVFPITVENTLPADAGRPGRQRGPGCGWSSPPTTASG